jgi:hypothetical protein
MKHRINTRNYDCGSDSQTGQRTNWVKFFSRHFQGCSKDEILACDWRIEDLPAIHKAIEKIFPLQTA